MQAGACLWQHEAAEAAQGEGSCPGETLPSSWHPLHTGKHTLAGLLANIEAPGSSPGDPAPSQGATHCSELCLSTLAVLQVVGDNVEASGAVQEILDAAGEKAAQAKATKVFLSTVALSEECA